VSQNAVTSNAALETVYKDVPREQQEILIRFRATHPPRELTLSNIRWKYFSGSQQQGPALLMLPGAIGKGEIAFRHILEFEHDYRVIAPDYPPVQTVECLLDGLLRILDAEKIDAVTIIGGSVGGGLAQCMVRKYPERVTNLVLSHTGVPTHKRGKLNSLGMKLLAVFPMSLIRAGLKWEISRLLAVAQEEKQFWLAYFGELASGLTREQLISGYARAIDLDLHYKFAPNDLTEWTGKILILESDNDSVVPPAERTALKALYPQAQVHTFQGAGHGASIVKRQEYISVVREFLSGRSSN
jgi:pimeloyl-ACP methyl ester carboxylesterase